MSVVSFRTRDLEVRGRIRWNA